MTPSIGPITLEGPGWVSGVAFRSMNVSESLGRPFRYQLEILSEQPNLSVDKVLGEGLTVVLDIGEFGKRYFNGIVAEFAHAGSVGRHHLYRLVLVPWLWLLSKTANSRIFQNLSVPDIIKEVFRSHGFSDIAEGLKAYKAREFVVQYRETDLQFVQRLMEEEGIYYFFTHQSGVHTLVLCDSPSSHEPNPFYEQLAYFPPDRQRAAHFDHIDGWEVIREVESGAYALTEFDFENPKSNLLASTAFEAKHAHGAFEYFDNAAGHKVVEAGMAHATVRLEELHANRERALGSGNARGLLVGGRVTMTEFPVAEYNAEYLVVSLNARLQTHPVESGQGTDEDVFRCRFVAIDGKRQFRPPRSVPKPTVFGAQTAIVVGPENEEIWTDKYGRVKVKFHWDRYAKGDETSSCWVRVAQVWAGSNFGALHIPRIGQEVIVEFLEGDPDRPIITGRVYNFDNMPPYELPTNQTQSGIKSRSTKKGSPDNFNEIRFEDKKGEEELFMQAEKNHTINVKNDQSTTVAANRSARVEANDSVSVGGDRSVSVKGNLSVSVDGGGAGAIQSAMTVTGKHNLHASDTIEVDAPTHIKLECGGSSILIEPGRITLTAGGQAQVVLDANVFAKASAGAEMLLDGNARTSSSGGSKVVLDSNVLAQSSSQSEMVLDSNAAMSSPADIILQGMNVSGKGQVQVTMEAGPSSAKLGPAGADVAGPMVNLNGMGNVNVAAPMIKIG